MVRVLHIEGQQNCQRHFLSHISFHAVEMIKSISHDWESCKEIYSINNISHHLITVFRKKTNCMNLLIEI